MMTGTFNPFSEVAKAILPSGFKTELSHWGVSAVLAGGVLECRAALEHLNGYCADTKTLKAFD